MLTKRPSVMSCLFVCLSSIEKSLKTKVEETINHMAAAGADRKHFAGVTRALSDQHHPL
jgi:hypothetical protein